MSIRGILAAAAVTVFTVGAAFAQDGQMKPEMKHDDMHHDMGAMAKPADDAAMKPEMTAEALKARLDKNEPTIVVDARSIQMGQRIKGSVHVPVAKLNEWAKDQDKKAVIVTYCTCPHDEAAINEVHQLRAMGFENAYSLAGGMHAASSAGIALEQTPQE